jgi:hypothetical protein
MAGRIGLACAGALLLTVAGCIPFLRDLTAAPRQSYAVAAPQSMVVGMIETGLGEAGVNVLTKRVDGVMRMAGQTKSGKVFCLYVKPDQGESGQQTLVTIRWDHDADEAFWKSVVAILKAAEAEPEQHDQPEEKSDHYKSHE